MELVPALSSRLPPRQTSPGGGPWRSSPGPGWAPPPVPTHGQPRARGDTGVMRGAYATLGPGRGRRSPGAGVWGGQAAPVRAPAAPEPGRSVSGVSPSTVLRTPRRPPLPANTAQASGSGCPENGEGPASVLGRGTRLGWVWSPVRACVGGSGWMFLSPIQVFSPLPPSLPP